MNPSSVAPPPEHFELAPRAALDEIEPLLEADRELFVGMLGMTVEEMRRGYARVRLPFRSCLLQGAGVVNGGVIASLLDFCPVPALLLARHPEPSGPTVDLHVQFHGAVVDEDMIGIGWITTLTRTIAFARAEVVTDTGRLVAVGTHTFKLRAAPHPHGDSTSAKLAG